MTLSRVSAGHTHRTFPQLSTGHTRPTFPPLATGYTHPTFPQLWARSARVLLRTIARRQCVASRNDRGVGGRAAAIGARTVFLKIIQRLDLLVWIFVLAVACPVTPGGAFAQSPPAGVIERDTVVPGPIPLPATITLPAGKGPFPGVVLVHNGTADGDRDETIGSIRLFRDLAWGLAQRGIVVLRYEKRSRTEPSWFARAGFTVFDETVQDAVAAARLLRRQVELNPKRIYVAGHGLGGIVAPRIAHTEGDLAGLIILAGATQVHLADQMEQQLNYKVTLAGADSFKVRYQLQPIRPLLERIRTLTAKDSFDIQPLRGLGGTSPKYWLDLNTPDPAAVLRTLKLPVLVMQGLKDFEMPAEDLDGWIKALGERRNLTVRRYPTLSHAFTESAGVPGPRDYADERTADEVFIADLAEWIKRN